MRTDINALAARVALATGIPVVLPPAWVAKNHADLGGKIIGRNLLASQVGQDGPVYSARAAWAGTVPGAAGPVACLIAEVNRPGTPEASASIGLLLPDHPDAPPTPIWSATTVGGLAAKIEGFLGGLVALGILEFELARLAPAARPRGAETT